MTKETVKLTKEEFIQRSMNGEEFKLDDIYFFYDKGMTIPFRAIKDDKDTSFPMDTEWVFFDGLTSFEVLPPKKKTRIVKEWLVKVDGTWRIETQLWTEEEAEEAFSPFGWKLEYKSTGREWEVKE